MPIKPIKVTAIPNTPAVQKAKKEYLKAMERAENDLARWQAEARRMRSPLSGAK